jgi:CRISPR-associated endonuclease/helicase Cas3
MLGHIPNAPEDPQITAGKTLTPKEIRQIDLAENSTVSTRRRAVLRIHPNLLPDSAVTKLRELLDPVRGEDPSTADFQELIREVLVEENFISANEELKTACEHLVKLSRRQIDLEYYPNNLGVVLTSRYRLSAQGSEDFEETETNPEALLEAPEPQPLIDHTQDVLDQVKNTLDLMPLSRWREALIAAVIVHDWGKADLRFQALLRGATPYAVIGSSSILAKSGSISQSAAARHAAREKARLPAGFRHELLSVQMAERPEAITVISIDPDLLALVLYLVATHHGYTRPFAPLVEDHDSFDVHLQANGSNISISSAERRDHPAHALDSGFAERFWRMNRRYGWWGIALLESVLRLADQRASAKRQLQPL